MKRPMYWITLFTSCVGIVAAPVGWRWTAWAFFCFLFYLYSLLETRLPERKP